MLIRHYYRLPNTNHIPHYRTEKMDKFHDENDVDVLYTQAVELVKKERRASTSYIQRKLRIGYNRAARILETMENRNIVSRPSENNGRRVLMNTEMKTHYIKTHVSLADDIHSGKKTAEFRYNDRTYFVGDQIEMSFIDDDGQVIESQMKAQVLITHAVYGPNFGIPEGYCMLSISDPLHWVEDAEKTAA